MWREIDELHGALAPRFFRVSPRSPDDWRRVLAAPQSAVFVDEMPGGVGGAVWVHVYDTPADPLMVPERRGYIDGLVVASDHRRQGIGRRLMDAAAAWATEQGAAQLVLTVWAGNAAARAFYHRLGYGLLSEVLNKPL